MIHYIERCVLSLNRIENLLSEILLALQNLDRP